MVSVLFFGATADAVGSRRLDFEIAEGNTTASVFNRVIAEYPLLSTHKLLFSRNQKYAMGAEKLQDGDELAVFTAVSGG